MKIAYLLMSDLLSDDGISKKVKSQVALWQEYGHEVNVFCALPNRPQNRIPQQENYHFFSFTAVDRFRLLQPEGLDKELAAFAPDIIYLRYELWKPYLSRLVKLAPAVVEINSDDISEYRLRKGLKGNLTYYYNIFTRDLLLNSSAGIVGVTQELLRLPCNARYNKLSAAIPNGIQLSRFPVVKTPKDGKIPQLVFIGKPNQPWQGVDKILHLAEKTEGRLQFHIIGSFGPYGGHPNVTCYGYMKKEEYESVFRQCDIGIGTLALHRKNMLEACPLKVREYLAYGLPIIIGYQDTAFFGSALPEWVLKLDDDEENVNRTIEQIVDFCYKMKDRVVEHEEIGFIDVNYTEKKRLEFLESIIR